MARKPTRLRGRQPAKVQSLRDLRARYDAAQTTDENRRHWANADQLSASAAASPEVRRILRNRARYEIANNSYAHGIVSTLANYIIGTGPRLQMLTDDPDANRVIEKEFSRWAGSVGLAHKLRTMRIAQCEDGECFGLLGNNDRLPPPVRLDLRLIEADRVASPWVYGGTTETDDGIEYDDFGNPTKYHVLSYHPGDLRPRTVLGKPDRVEADLVIHLFRSDRPGQTRGITEIASALPLFALLRRYTLAVVTSAEQAALPSGVIYTDAPAEEEAGPLKTLDTVDMYRGEWMTMPYGWKIGQVRAEQPTTVYGDFKHELINEIARCLDMPYNLAAGNSADYNYASGRLDHQSFYKAVKVNQTVLADVVLDRVFYAWLKEASLIDGYLPPVVRVKGAILLHQWFWDGLEHVDPAKEANAQAMRLASNTTTLAAEFAKSGLDWESELHQRAREQRLARELGLDDVVGGAAIEDDDEGGD